MTEEPLQTAVRIASRRLVWFLALLYFLAILDRVNVGFAALTMNRALGLTAEQFGFGAGVFFVGYMVFEVPSNLVLARVGARRWIARIMVTWGLCSMAIAFATGPRSFFVLRFLLGAAEAGFFPGVIWYLARWFPAANRARMNALFLLGLPLSNATAALVSGPILGLNGVAGLAGWQWLLMLEGLPAVLAGIATWFYLTDSPERAVWMPPVPRDALVRTLAHERAEVGSALTPAKALLHPTLWALGLVYFGLNVGLSSLGMWLPQIVKALGLRSAIETGLVAAAILLAGAAVMFFWSRHSDRHGERVWHTGLAAALAACGWALCALSADPLARSLALVVASAGTYACVSVFWTLPAGMLSDRAAAGGIALVGSLGSLGGFAGPWTIGVLRQATGGFEAAFLAVAACLLVSFVVAIAAGRSIFAAAARVEGYRIAVRD